MLLLSFLNIILLISLITAQEIQSETTRTEKIEDVSTHSNETIEKKNDTVEMHKITQPIQMQQIERASDGGTNISIKANEKNKSDFRPSPHLETYLEFNKFPVVPALPEAKHISALKNGEDHTTAIADSFFNKAKQFSSIKNGDSRSYPWYEKGNQKEEPWISRVKFPSSNIKDHPYPFISKDKTQFSIGISSNKSNLDKTYLAKPNNEGYGGKDYYGLTRYENIKSNENWDKFEHGNYGKPQQHKPQYEYSVPEKTHTEVSPWKKVIKLLATFIPIGLLISALTPSVITIMPMNMTQARNRAVDDNIPNNNRIITSLNYLHRLNTEGCAERILCELVLSAGSSKNPEEHVENLLQAFTEEEKGLIESTEDLKEIFDAVKKHDCTTLACENINK